MSESPSQAADDAALRSEHEPHSAIGPDVSAKAQASSAPSHAGETPLAAAPPSYRFLGIIAACVLLADAVTKFWAETTLSRLTRAEPAIVLIEDVLTFTLAYNKGGAFGMFAGEDDAWRGPFFLIVSAAASVFIISLYRRIQPNQWALRWGLPLVLGGALGNFADRLAKGRVVDFIDYRAGWVETMNELIAKVNSSWHVTSHWPTFNVADIAICIGVGFMIIDMFTAGSQSGSPSGSSSKPASAG